MSNKEDEKAAEEYRNNHPERSFAILNLLQQSFLHGIEHERSRNGWVSVKTRLPELGKCVLVCNPRSIPPTYGWVLGDGTWMINDEPDDSCQKIDHVSFVTHWMPLPKPPEGE